MISRRELISGAAALAGMQALRGQQRGTPQSIRYGIPTGPIARWRLHLLGQSLAEGATISSVTDDSGNGNTLTPWTGQTAQSPYYTNAAINGRGAFWPGTVVPGGAVANTPTGVPKGALASPNIALAETPLTVLFCLQGGSGAQPNSSGVFQIGQIGLSCRNGNAQFPVELCWVAFTYSGHGNYNITDPGGNSQCSQLFGGPVCGAFVNGFGGAATSTRYMLNRTRVTLASQGWSASNSWTNLPIVLGYSTFTGVNNPFPGLYHEVAIYNRALTDAELDLWQVYCNQMYSSPLYQYNGGSSPLSHITRRVVFLGASTWGGQNSVLGENVCNLVAGQLGKSNHVEFVEYGVGSATSTVGGSSIQSNIADINAIYDSSLGAGNNIIVYGDYPNDYQTGGVTDPATEYTNLTGLWQALQSHGWVVIPSTFVIGNSITAWAQWGGYTSTSYGPGTAPGLNWRIINNAAGCNAVIDLSQGQGLSSAIEQYFAAQTGGHYSSVEYGMIANVVAPAINSLL